MEAISESVSTLFSVNFVLLPSSSVSEQFDGQSRPSVEDVFRKFREVRNVQASFRDPSSNLVHNINKLYMKFTDVRTIEKREEVNSKSANKKLLYDCVSTYSGRDEYFTDSSLETPWYDLWKEKVLSTFEQCEHEFIGASFGSVFVMTLKDLDDFRTVISDQLTRVKALTKLQWFCPNFLKYFLVIHVRKRHQTASTPEQEIGPDYLEKFQELLSIYGTGQCFLLEMNESEFIAVKKERQPQHNSQEISSHIERNLSNGGDKSADDPLMVTAANGTIPNDSLHRNHHAADNAYNRQDSVQMSTMEYVLGENLRNSMESMLREMIVKALIPWSERQLRVLNESISLRKGLRKSLFNATKQLFVMSSSSVNMKSPGTPGLLYSPEGNEMQQRKVADLFMCLTLYELAHSFYYVAKKEFQIEGASLYFAGASESLGIASILINKFQKHYFEEAIITYIDVCKNPELATRATILATDALLSLWPNDSANLYIRMTSEDSDLRSALFLEQAAKCFLRSNVARTRKAAFHYVLAGHRYNKCGLKRHALACYSKFASPHWTHAIDHVNSTVTRLQAQLTNSDPNYQNNVESNGSATLPSYLEEPGQ